MHVVSGVPVGVLNFDQIPRSAFHPRENHASFADRLHRCSTRRGVVDPEMRPVFLQDGMEAMRAEMRCDWRGELERRMQKRLLHRLPFRREICRNSGIVMEKYRSIWAPCIFVFCGENPAIRKYFAIRKELLLDYHAKRIARAWIGVEIQVPTENLRQTHRQFRFFTGVNHRLKQRAVNFSHHSNRLRFRWNGLNLGMKLAALRSNGA